MRSIGWILLGCAIVCGCELGPRSGRGLRLPDGEPDRGRAAFLELGCWSCHDVAGVSLAVERERADPIVVLGGEVTRIETHGELITSIVHPSRELAEGYPVAAISEEGRSRMRALNERMTVAQLIDLTAFLQRSYVLRREPRPMP